MFRLLLALLPLSILFGFYLVYLDQSIRATFEGKRWSLPARVYARPLELVRGAPVTPNQLAAELQRLGYRLQEQVKEPGSFARNGGRFQVRTRSFRFADGEQPSRYLDIRFEGQQLESVKDTKGQEMRLTRLEATEIGSIHPAQSEDRVLVQYSDLPPLLIQTLVAVEDRTYFEHHGVDPRGILRALWTNVRAGGVVQGGSTLTQQLVKNFYLTPERSIGRKINEMLMALLLDLRYSKEEILEAYANEIYLGQDGDRAIHGFGLASRFYFNRDLKELDLPRIALLIGIIRGPSAWNPRRHEEKAKERRDLVLNLLREQGIIQEGRMQSAKQAPLGVTKGRGHGGGSFPAFLDLVRRQLREDYKEEDLNSNGLRIFTTLDPWIQQQAEEAVAAQLPLLEKGRKLTDPLESAVVVAESATGEVLALVGGRDSNYQGFNRAIDAQRSIGSLIKPVVYLAALEQSERYTLITRIKDTPVSLKGKDGQVWSPKNYDKESHGEVPLQDALANSYNLATVRLGLDVGVPKVIETLRALGLDRPVDPFPSLLLGAVALSPLEVAQLYQTLAADGFRSPLRVIRAVQAGEGTELQRYPLKVQQAVPAGPLFLLNRSLQQVVREGTGKGLKRWLPPEIGAAGKTGTTDEMRDSWFAGFTGDRVAVVWVGLDDNGPTGLSGASGALPVWGELMKRVQPRRLELFQPEGVEMVWIDPETGQRADQSCAGARQEAFIIGSAPAVQSSCMHGTDLRRILE